MKKNSIGKLKLFLTKIIPFIPIPNEVISELNFTSADEARKAYRNSRSGSKIRKIIAISWDKLSFNEIDNTKTVDQIRRANRDSRPGSEAEKVSTTKWDELSLKQVFDANTIDEIRTAITFSRSGSKAEKIGKQKEERILLELIKETNTIAGIQGIRRNYVTSSNEKVNEAVKNKIDKLSEK
ncbi:MAG: hypothetical protein PHN66_00645 [Candidatus Shapirobacteria bacterium]|nr:hypothetical protein [Candidatus Shapirobacteria bacterium]